MSDICIKCTPLGFPEVPSLTRDLIILVFWVLPFYVMHAVLQATSTVSVSILER